MRALTAIDLVNAWEQGWASGCAERSLLLLGLAHPDISDEDLEAMPLGIRDDLLLQLRQQLFGPWLASVVICSQCSESLEIGVDANELRAACASSEDAGMDWTQGDLLVRFRVPTSGDLRDLEGYRDPLEVRRRLLECCVVEAHRGGETIEPFQLTQEETVVLGEHIAQADPGGELILNTECPRCGRRWECLLDIASFLWDEIDIQVRRLLGDVHALASAYSWSERDILTMSARRRQMYLEELRPR